MSVGGAGIPGPDLPMSPINAYVILLTEHRDGKVDRLEGVGIGAFLHLGLIPSRVDWDSCHPRALCHQGPGPGTGPSFAVMQRLEPGRILRLISVLTPKGIAKIPAYFQCDKAIH